MGKTYKYIAQEFDINRTLICEYEIPKPNFDNPSMKARNENCYGISVIRVMHNNYCAVVLVLFQ